MTCIHCKQMPADIVLEFEVRQLTPAGVDLLRENPGGKGEVGFCVFCIPQLQSMLTLQQRELELRPAPPRGQA